MKIELTKEDREMLIQMMESSTIPVSRAEEVVKVLKKLKEAKE